MGVDEYPVRTTESGTPASDITFTPTGSIAATNVQDALAEIGLEYAAGDAAVAAAAASALATHDSDTTSVHGITNTANLVLTSDSRLSDARTPTGAAGGVLGGTYPNPSFAADMATQAELDAHDVDTTSVHGITDTANLVVTSDSRLSDARTPTGAAGGVLGGTYPNPSFAADMATQAELDAHDIDTTSVHGITDTSDLMLKSIVDAKGDLITATADNTPVRHAAGNDGEVPMWDSSVSDNWRNAVLSDAKALNNLLGWSVDLTGATSGTALTVATIQIAKIPLRRKISITNVIAYLSTVGVTLTHCYAMVHKSDGTLIGQSADQSANWVAGVAPAGVGIKTMALAGGPFDATPLGANDFVWASLYVGTLGTAPQFARVPGFGTLFNANLAAATARFGQFAVADTATPGNITPASIVINSSSIAFFMGLS